MCSHPVASGYGEAECGRERCRVREILQPIARCGIRVYGQAGNLMIWRSELDPFVAKRQDDHDGRIDHDPTIHQRRA